MNNNTLPSLYLQELSTRQVGLALESGFDTALIMLGAQEQHGPHLPLSTDTLWGYAVGGRVAKILGNVLVAPTLPVGVSSEHMSFSGSMTIRQETFSATLTDYVVSLERSGFRWIVCLPSHGGNVEPLRVALPSIEAAVSDSRFIGFTDLYGLIAVGASVAERFNVSSAAAGAHAGEWETSMILALRPDLVASDRLEQGYMGELEPVFDRIMIEGMESVTPNGILGDAKLATAEHGKVYLDALTDFYAKWIRRAQMREGRGE